jgi:formylmethanofuran dehydrogenase subunit E
LEVPEVDESFVCDDCGEKFTSEDQADLSQLKLSKTNCEKCYKANSKK